MSSRTQFPLHPSAPRPSVQATSTVSTKFAIPVPAPLDPASKMHAQPVMRSVQPGPANSFMLTPFERIQVQYFALPQSASEEVKKEAARAVINGWDNTTKYLLFLCTERLRCPICKQSPLDPDLINNHYLSPKATSVLNHIKKQLQNTNPFTVLRRDLEVCAKDFDLLEILWAEGKEGSCGQLAWNGQMPVVDL